MTAGRYVARIVEVPDHGIKLEPAEDSVTPLEAARAIALERLADARLERTAVA